MKGFEYVAKYNLGYNVPFAVWKDVTGKYSNWTEISNKGRGRYMPIFEMAYNHFENGEPVVLEGFGTFKTGLAIDGGKVVAKKINLTLSSQMREKLKEILTVEEISD